jgi:hypothetical protein
MSPGFAHLCIRFKVAEPHRAIERERQLVGVEDVGRARPTHERGASQAADDRGRIIEQIGNHHDQPRARIASATREGPDESVRSPGVAASSA